MEPAQRGFDVGPQRIQGRIGIDAVEHVRHAIHIVFPVAQGPDKQRGGIQDRQRLACFVIQEALGAGQILLDSRSFTEWVHDEAWGLTAERAESGAVCWFGATAVRGSLGR